MTDEEYREALHKNYAEQTRAIENSACWQPCGPEGYENDSHRCSNCKEQAIYDDCNGEWLTTYCPWCGRKMDEPIRKARSVAEFFRGLLEQLEKARKEEGENAD